MDRLNKKPYRPLLSFFALFSVLGLSASYAQEQITKLDEVEIVASPIQKYGVGANVTVLDSNLISTTKQASLAQLLSTQSAVYIKQYGVGMLSTISFRGTGASHTSVMWNGMQVGYPFLGQTDLSLVPLDFIDEISLLHGSASARFGTGAIGGMIDLKSNKPNDGFGVGLNQSFGSFGTLNSTIQISNGGDKGFVKVGGYYKKSTNNFPYKSASGKQLGNQENADFDLMGAQLSALYYMNTNNSLAIDVQATKADRSLQSSINSSAANNQKDENVWSSLRYKHIIAKGSLAAQYGYLYDQINYEGSITSSNQHKGGIVFEYEMLPGLSTETGLNTTLIEVNTPFYDNEQAQETRTNIYASVAWHPMPKLGMSLNLRQAFVTGYTVPFTPSLGIDFNILKSINWELDLKSQLAKGYRVPTLNDRFWVSGGNQNLNPEESVNAEIGIHLKNKADTPFWVKATTYQLWVNNWILWLPNGAVWSPENKRKVKGLGVEVEMGAEKNLGDVALKGWLNYAYTKSTNLVARDEYDRTVGKQLPYVPFHNGNITGLLKVGQWQVQANALVTGKRFTTGDNTNEKEVTGYALLNIQTSYNFNINKWSTRVYLDVNNITNTNYQSIINRAMPGINFLAGVKINFNK